MEVKEKLLQQLRNLKPRTRELAQQLAKGEHRQRDAKELGHQWYELSRKDKKIIREERVAAQSEFRLAVVRGELPLPIIEIVYGKEGKSARLLAEDLIALSRRMGICMLEISSHAVRDLLNQAYPGERPDDDEPGYIADHWLEKSGPFSRSRVGAEREEFFRAYGTRRPPRVAPVGEPSSKKNEARVPGRETLDGLSNLGPSIERASENLVGGILFAALLGAGLPGFLKKGR